MRKIRWTLAVIAVLAVIFTACGKKEKDGTQGKARTPDEIKENGEIVIGVFSDKKPFGYVDENGTYQGYDVYFGNRMAEDLGVKVKYIPV